MLAVVSACIFLLSDWSTHSPWSITVAFGIAIAACFPVWRFWQRRQAIASDYPVVERVNAWRYRHGTKVQLFADDENSETSNVASKAPDRVDSQA